MGRMGQKMGHTNKMQIYCLHKAHRTNKILNPIGSVIKKYMGRYTAKNGAMLFHLIFNYFFYILF